MFTGAGRYWDNLKHQARNLITDEPPEVVEVMDMPEDTGLIGSWQEMSALSYKQRFIGFFTTFSMGLFLIVIALLLIPTIAIVPKKFAFFLTAGNVFCISSTTFLVGFQQQFRSLFDAKRLEAAIVYIASIILTLLGALHWKSSLVAIVFAVIQVFCLLWYALSYVPFARRAVGVVCSYAWYFILPIIRVASQSLAQCCGFLFSRVRLLGMRCAKPALSIAASSVVLPKWKRKEVGPPGTHEWRMFFTSECVTRAAFLPNTVMCSAWHDITLYPAQDPSIITFVCEIPKGTRAKIELQKEEPHNPFAQDIHKKKEGKLLRFYTFGDIPFNYGFAPQTWEDPSLVDAYTKCVGDGDPIDIVEVSKSPMTTGSIHAVRVLGVLGLIDEGETDWKIIAESVGSNDDGYRSLKNVPQGLKDTIVRWMRDYKTTDGKKQNELMFSGEIRGMDDALEAVQTCSRQYADLISGTVQNHGYWLR